MKTLREILTSRGFVESSTKSDRPLQIRCISQTCPCQTAEHRHLYVYMGPEHGAGFGWCYRCRAHFFADQILSSLLGISLKEAKGMLIGSTDEERIRYSIEQVQKQSRAMSVFMSDVDLSVPDLREVSADKFRFPRVSTRPKSAYYQYLIRRGFTKQKMEMYDVRYSEYQRMAGRVIFPIVQEKRLVGYLGRSIQEVGRDVKTKFAKKSLQSVLGHKKVLNNEGFRASLILYNLDNVLRYKVRDTIYIVEGVFDTVPDPSHTLALLGKSLTKPQRALLAKHFDLHHIVMCLDQDAQDDNMRHAQMLLDDGFAKSVSICYLPNGHDPNSLFTTYPEEYDQIIHENTVRV